MTGLNSIESINGALHKYKYSYEKCMDCIEGEEAVKKSPNRQTYLPMLTGQKLDGKNGLTLYNTYKQYAYFFPAAGRTVDGYSGVAFRKAPFTTVENDDIINDVTLNGQPLDDFAKNVFDNVVVNYRPAILVDYNEDAKRAYMRLYKSLDILDWRQGYIGGLYQVNFVKLRECIEVVDPEDEFNTIIMDQIRVLDIDDSGYYRQRLYQRPRVDINYSNITLSAGEYTLVYEINPEMRGKKFNNIPIIPVSPNGQQWDLDFSPINDLCDVSLVYYRVSASYKNAQLLTGNPTPVFKGLLSQDGEKESDVGLGSSRVLQLEDNGDAFFLTLGSDGLAELRTDLETLKKDMAVVGARILSSDPKGVESAETAQIHRAGEQSLLMSIGKSVSRGIEKALKIAVLWTEETNIDDIEYKLSIDFDVDAIDAQLLSQLWAMYTAGTISYNVFYSNLKKGEIFPDGWTKEDEEKALEETEKKKQEETEKELDREIPLQNEEEEVEEE